MGNAERADVVVDFTRAPVGAEFYLINEGPDEPFGGGTAGVDFAPANPATTGQIMKFVVGPLASTDTSVPPDQLALPAFTPIGPATLTRQLSLNELDSAVLEGVGPLEDAHPIHIHEVQFQVVNREPMDGSTTPRSPEAWEAGFKDTVIAYPGEVTRVESTFDLPGRYVWHCHIVEHEDNEMMRPYQIG